MKVNDYCTIPNHPQPVKIEKLAANGAVYVRLDHSELTMVQPLKVVQVVNLKQINNIIATRKPVGRFIAESDGKFIAVDNTTSEAWTEEFLTKPKALEYLFNLYL